MAKIRKTDLQNASEDMKQLELPNSAGGTLKMAQDFGNLCGRLFKKNTQKLNIYLKLSKLTPRY